MSPTPQPPRRRILTMLLILSLGANLLIVGMVAGAWWSGGPPHRAGGGGGSGPGGGINPFVQAFDDSDRRAVRRALRQRSEVLRNSSRQALGDAQAFVSALQATPFDLGGLEDIFQSQKLRAADHVALGQAVLIERISQMSDSERQAYATRLEAAFAEAEERRKNRRKKLRPRP